MLGQIQAMSFAQKEIMAVLTQIKTSPDPLTTMTTMTMTMKTAN